MTMIFNTLANNPQQIPKWFVTGRTTMAPKKEPTNNPGNYRPITCLPIIYKLLSKILSNKMKEHLQKNKLIPDEQKGCMANCYGTLDQLLIDQMV